ncbi:hypothetical protein APSETT444_010397 [Aspergillus pseudonomiae]
MLSFKSPLWFVSLAAVVGTASAAQKFGLYAYGENVGGLPLYYVDGSAVVSPKTPENGTDVAPVACKSPSPTTIQVSLTDPSVNKDSDNELIGNPNTTSTASTPAFTDASLFVPGPNSNDKEMGFTSDPSSNQVTNKFVWYGNFLLVENDSGEYTSLFSVKKSSTHDEDGSYDLYWNVTDSNEEVITISMRSVAPSNK